VPRTESQIATLQAVVDWCWLAPMDIQELSVVLNVAKPATRRYVAKALELGLICEAGATPNSQSESPAPSCLAPVPRYTAKPQTPYTENSDFRCSPKTLYEDPKTIHKKPNEIRKTLHEKRQKQGHSQNENR